MRWEPAAGAKPERAKKVGMRRRTRQASIGERVEAGGYPVVTIAVAATALVLWLAGYVTANAPFTALAAMPDVAWQVWRYVTSAIAFPAGSQVIFTVLGIGIFVYIGWGAERRFGRRRFIALFLVSTAAAAAVTVLAGGTAVGLSGAIWGLVGAYLIEVWQHPAARNQMLITIVIWLLVSIFLGGGVLSIIAGGLSGVGATLLLRRFADRPSVRPSTPYLLLAAGVAVLVVLAILRNAVVV